jgi:hypothetical protein
MLTNLPLPGEERDTSVLVTAVHNFVAAHAREPHGRTPDGRPDVIVEALHAVEAAPREPAEVWLCGTPMPGVRVVVGAYEALEIPYHDGCIVYCGPQSLADAVRFDLDQPV